MIQLNRRNFSKGGTMNKFIKENFNKILSVFILMQPILDLITGICVHANLNITIGIIIRMIFLTLIMYTTTFIYKKKLSILTYLAFFAYSILYLIGIVIYKDGVLFQELQGLLKVIYFPIILISLYELKDEFKASKMTLFSTLLMYLVFILVPNTLGLGFKSYEITKSGTLGFYNSANEISGIISILTPIMFIILKDMKNIFLKIIYIIIYLIVILTIGTKTPLLTLFIIIGFTYLYYMIVWIKNKKYQPILYTALVIIVGLSSLLLILPKTTFYKNIKVHLDYLEVDNVLDVFKDKELIDHFIFSQRLTFFDKKAKNYADATLYQQLFGIGYTKNNKTTKLIEMDYFDILYSQGLIGFTLIFSIYLLVLYCVLRKKQKLTYDRYMLKLSLGLILILSLLTGHIITAPAVALITIMLILSLSKRNKKNLLFTAVNFEIGGIENALINLLNNINYDKYNVDVILEENKGILLPKVNKNAKVKELKVNNNKNVFIRKLINFTNKLMFTIFNYHNYDFSCCYATYSLSSNKLALTASKNSSIYVHSNYKQLYEKDNDFRKFFDDRKINEFNKIIFVSNESRDCFTKLYKDLTEKTEVINNFIDIKKIKKLSLEKIENKKQKNKKLFVFVGRLDDSSKKVKRAINIAKEIKNVELWIIGDGPDKKMYEEYAKGLKNVIFFGKKTNPYPYMAKADYIILTSDYEGFPVTYLEAIVLSKPIITTIDVSDDEINIGADYAKIISKDEKQMIKEIENILDKGFNQKETDFTLIQQKRIKKLEKIFDEVI